jgi:hypothetical protein
MNPATAAAFKCFGLVRCLMRAHADSNCRSEDSELELLQKQHLAYLLAWRQHIGHLLSFLKNYPRHGRNLITYAMQQRAKIIVQSYYKQNISTSKYLTKNLHKRFIVSQTWFLLYIMFYSSSTWNNSEKISQLRKSD